MSENEQAQAREAGIEVAVLGSARLTEDDERWHQAYRLGEQLAGAGFVTVTGGYGGLMAAVSRGAHSAGGQVIGLPMRHWSQLEPNTWNTALRWSTDYGMRLNYLQQCSAVIALPGGVGTLSELAMAWAARQTEGRPMPLVLLGECWPPLISAIRECLIVGEEDLQLLHFARHPEDAVEVVKQNLQAPGQRGPGPRG